MNPTFRILLVVVLAMNAVGIAHATELGINYYHESMMSDQWKLPYINDLTLDQANKDFADISKIASHVKFYMNPFVQGNDDWIVKLADKADNYGLYTVVNMMVDDRQLETWNWDSYASKVRDDCSKLSGKVDEILVGNEIILHSSMSKYEIRNRVEKLISECESRFSGEVGYEAFWYEKEAWFDYPGQIYFMQYESLSSFRTNVKEMQDRFGSKALVGEFGEDMYDESTFKDDWFQKESMEARWKIMEDANVPIAYLFAYREPSWNGMGLIRPDGIKRPMYAFFAAQGSGVGDTPYNPPTTSEPTPKPQPEAPSTHTQLSQLDVSCTATGGCWKVRDVSDSQCRYVTYGTPKGEVQTNACDKNGNIEVYRNSYPGGQQFQICYGNTCVSSEKTTTKETTPTTSGGSSELSKLATSCESDAGCWIKTDDTSGTCRTVRFGTARGDIKVLTCEKSSGSELYVQSQPSDLAFKACVGSLCATHNNGYADSTTPQRTDSSSQATTLGSLPVSCQANTDCKISYDRVDGSCRRVTFSTGKGALKTLACQKDSGVEVYVTEYPSNLDFTACFGSACVRDEQGFAKTSLDSSTSSPSRTQASSLDQLSTRATPNGRLKGDWTSGTCRTIQYDTDKGWIEAQVCDKADKYEVYLKTQNPQGELCVETACVNKNSGFATLNK